MHIVTNILHHLIRRTVSNIFTKCRYELHAHICIFFTLYHLISFSTNGNSILPWDLGPLHQRIRQYPLELLVHVPVVEDRPATVRSNLKNGSIYISMKPNTIHGNKIKLWVLFIVLQFFYILVFARLMGRHANELINIVST